MQGRHAKVKFMLANLLIFLELAIFGLAYLSPALLARDIVLVSMMFWACAYLLRSSTVDSVRLRRNVKENILSSKR